MSATTSRRRLWRPIKVTWTWEWRPRWKPTKPSKRGEANHMIEGNMWPRLSWSLSSESVLFTSCFCWLEEIIHHQSVDLMDEKSNTCNLYSLLGCEETASNEQLKTRYKQLALKVSGCWCELFLIAFSLTIWRSWIVVLYLLFQINISNDSCTLLGSSCIPIKEQQLTMVRDLILQEEKRWPKQHLHHLHSPPPLLVTSHTSPKHMQSFPITKAEGNTMHIYLVRKGGSTLHLTLSLSLILRVFLSAERTDEQALIHDEVSIKQFTRTPDSDLYHLLCRCGSSFTFHANNSPAAGSFLLTCDSCSLCVLVNVDQTEET